VVKRLVVSRNAYFHIDRIIEFNNTRNQSSTYSKKFITALFKELRRLKRFPLMGIKTGRDNTYLLIWDNYYVYYTFSDSIIEVKSIFHQKENIDH
jgi:plasmid stabilization system protein ParE